MYNFNYRYILFLYKDLYSSLVFIKIVCTKENYIKHWSRYIIDFSQKNNIACKYVIGSILQCYKNNHWPGIMSNKENRV